MTDAEVARRVTLPWVRSGIIGATVLGLGPGPGRDHRRGHDLRVDPAHRAQHLRPHDHHRRHHRRPSSTRPSTDGTGFAVATLAEAGLVLAVISVAVNLAARMIVNRTGRLMAPVGA